MNQTVVIPMEYKGETHELLIDMDDVPKTFVHAWRIKPGVTGVIYVRSTPTTLLPPTYIHRLIMNATEVDIVDHKNGNGLDNRKENLRFCTRQENAHNSKIRNNAKFRGVYPNGRGRFNASVFDGKKRLYLGSFATDVEAAIAHDEAAKRLRGEFVRLNFPEVNHG